VAWPTFGRLSTLHDEIERLFDTPFSALAATSELLNGWAPRLDVYEDKENVYVKAELPGLKREEIELSLQDGTLSLSGERKSETRTEGTEQYRSERFFGRFQRTISLPAPIATDKVKAEYKDGILTVTLPKTEEAKPKKIEVSVN
jgi:HSP20 family protein